MKTVKTKLSKEEKARINSEAAAKRLDETVKAFRSRYANIFGHTKNDFPQSNERHICK